MRLLVIILALLLVGTAMAGDRDHLANAPQYAPNTWGIMTTALHTVPSLGESQLFGASFAFDVNIALEEYARAIEP